MIERTLDRASPTWRWERRRLRKRDSILFPDSLRIVKQGTARTVLVTDLFASEGPFQEAARDFVAGTCSVCGVVIGEQDARFHNAGYLCSDCWQFAGVLGS